MAPYASTSVPDSVLPSSTTFSLIHELTTTSAAPSGSLVTSAVDHTIPADAQRYYDVLTIVLNCISISACIFVVVLYILLKRKSSRLMSRTSLKISVAMASTDLLFHISNLARYGKALEGFACAFVGGWLFAFPGILSMFYACAIALNTQVVFVHRGTVKENREVLFLVVPVVLTLLITVPALIAGVFGDCQMGTLSDKTNIIKALLALYLWLFVSCGYLLVAVPLICYSIFSSRSPMAGLGERSTHRVVPRIRTHTTDSIESLAATLAWRDIARRALTIRVLGYIMVPVLFVMPGAILDILDRTNLAPVPEVAVIITMITPGLMGTFNALLFRMDPSVVAVIHSLRAREQRSTNRQHHNARVLDGRPCETEPGQSVMTTTVHSQRVLLPTVHIDTTDDDNGLEYEGHFTVGNPSLPSLSSTIGYSANELADTYNGL